MGRAVLLKQALRGRTGSLGQTSLGRSSLLGLTLLRLWQTSLEQIDLLELMFLGQTGSLR